MCRGNEAQVASRRTWSNLVSAHCIYVQTFDARAHAPEHPTDQMEFAKSRRNQTTDHLLKNLLKTFWAIFTISNDSSLCVIDQQNPREQLSFGMNLCYKLYLTATMLLPSYLLCVHQAARGVLICTGAASEVVAAVLPFHSEH